MKKFFGILLLILLSSCTTTKYYLRPDSDIETLSICISYSDYVPEELRYLFDQAAGDYINNFNNEMHDFILTFCDDPNRNAVLIDVNETILVSKSRQVSSTLLNIVGVSLPFIMIANGASFYVFFYTIPNDVSKVNVHLTEDLTTTKVSYPMNFTNSGYLLSEEKQMRNHTLAFRNFLNGIVTQIEKQHMITHQ